MHHLTDNGIENGMHCSADSADLTKPARYMDEPQFKDIRITVRKQKPENIDETITEGEVTITKEEVTIGKTIQFNRPDMTISSKKRLDDNKDMDVDITTEGDYINFEPIGEVIEPVVIIVSITYTDNSLEEYEVTVKKE